MEGTTENEEGNWNYMYKCDKRIKELREELREIRKEKRIREKLDEDEEAAGDFEGGTTRITREKKGRE